MHVKIFHRKTTYERFRSGYSSQPSGKHVGVTNERYYQDEAVVEEFRGNPYDGHIFLVPPIIIKILHAENFYILISLPGSC